MTALYIILGIIAFFVIVLSIPVVLDLEYTDAVRCKVSWLFLKFDLYPFPEKKKKEEKPKEEKKEEKPEEKKEEKPKPKKENFLKTFYNNQGLAGVIELLNNCGPVTGLFHEGELLLGASWNDGRSNVLQQEHEEDKGLHGHGVHPRQRPYNHL